jgi:predicted site-specific integrase-resolvase
MDWLSEKEVAQILEMNTKTLARWRERKLGPPYYALVKPRYRRSDVEQWLETRRRA